MKDNQINVASFSDSNICKYSSDNIRKSLNLSRKFSDLDLEKSAEHYFDLALLRLGLDICHNVYDNHYFDKNDFYSYRAEIYQEAINYLNQAILINPLYANAYVILSMARKDDQEKIDDLTQAIIIDPNNYWAYYWRAYHLGAVFGDSQGAIDDLTRCIAIDPNNYEAYKGICDNTDLAWPQDKLDELHQVYQKITQYIGLNPYKYEAYQDRAYIRRNLKDYQGAIDDYTKCISIKKNNFDAHKGRAEAKKMLEDYQGVIEDCTECIKRAAKHTDSYLLRSSAKESLGDYQGAIDDCSLAILTLKGTEDYVQSLFILRERLTQRLSSY